MSDNATTTTGPWGPYHDHIGEGLAHCADYLGRLQRSLAGEIAPDRHYFLTKAAALRDASVGVLRRARDVERWLGACDAEYGADGDGDEVRSCTRPAGHVGGHDDRPSLAERAGGRAEALAALTTEVADGLAWATLAVDASDDGPEVADALLDAARRLGELARGAASLAAEVTALAAGRPC
jgi:hypothetical protein